jgi:hypothetical protein
MMGDGEIHRDQFAGRLREESGTCPAHGLAMIGLRVCGSALSASRRGPREARRGSRRCRRCPTILASPCRAVQLPRDRVMKTEELRKQLLAALREEADEMDLANPAAKATETLESFVLTESLGETTSRRLRNASGNSGWPIPTPPRRIWSCAQSRRPAWSSGAEPRSRRPARSPGGEPANDRLARRFAFALCAM